jgi:uncharacterized membrane protein YccC
MTTKSFIQKSAQISRSKPRRRLKAIFSSKAMTFPALQNWIFSLKTLIAALLALLISLWIPLSNPYWSLATVYIASNPLSGATRSKAIFRVIGTLLGASAAVVLVPNLANAPVLLVAALALWSSVCLYMAMLDRTPRSYIFMLAGYTAALIGFPVVNLPGTIFEVALARTEEIFVGILCAAVVSSVLFPRAVFPAIAQRLNVWLANADIAACEAIQRKSGHEVDAHRLRLAADTGEIENLATHLVYDTARYPDLVHSIRDLRPRMLMLIPILSSISDRVLELTRLGGPSKSTRQLIDRLSEWLQADENAKTVETLEIIRSDLDSTIDGSGIHRSWRDLVELSLLIRLQDLAAIRADCFDIKRSVEIGSTSVLRELSYTFADSPAATHHRDHGLALLSAFVSFTTISVVCALWIGLAWPEGGAAVMMAAVAGNLFSAQDDPVPSILVFAKWAVVSILIASTYVFLVLPNVHNFETLALALAPTLLLFGLCISNPDTLLIGLSLAINSAAMIGLQVSFSTDTATFWNNAIAISAGVILAAATTSLLRTLGAEWSIKRLAHANRQTLMEISSAAGAQEDARLTGIMLDRLILLAPRAKAAGHRIPGVIGELREGFNILDLKRSRHGLTTYSRRRVDAVLMLLKRHYEHRAARPALETVLAAINRALAVVRNEQSAAAHNALLGLVALHSLFADRTQPHLTYPSAFLEAAE